MILELLLDALLDSVKMLPFLFAAYWLIEYVEHRHSEGIEKALAGGGRFGFVPGAVLGLLPQCGFSAMAANLYASKVVTLGTLLAVFLATSDEAVPLLIANPEHWRSLALILGIKLAVALAAGFCIDFVFKRLIPQSVRGGYTKASKVPIFGLQIPRSIFDNVLTAQMPKARSSCVIPCRIRADRTTEPIS